MAPALLELDTLVYLVGEPYDAFHLHPLFMRRALVAADAAGRLRGWPSPRQGGRRS